jgi:glycosyltransferase involved in cell wall biosynthesis
MTTIPLSLDKLLSGQFTYMQKQGIEVLLASSEGEEIKKIEEETGLKVHVLPLTRAISPWQDLKALWATYRLIKRIKPDIVHTHTPKAGLIGMLAAYLAGVPVRMHTVAGLPVMETTGIKKKTLMLTEKLTSWAASGVYPNSFALKEYMIQKKLAPQRKLRVLAKGSSNGINLSHYDPQCYKEGANVRLRESLGIQKTDFVFTFIGRLVGDKGINELVEAFNTPLPPLKGGTDGVSILKGGTDGESILKGGTDGESILKGGITTSSPLEGGQRGVFLLLIGSEEPNLDPLQEKTRAAIDQNPNIITTGWQDDVRPYLAITDVFVFPSYREGMPNVVLQAGAMGLPQIVTDINGSNEIVKHGENGIIVPSKDIESLQKAMQQLMTDDSLRVKMKEVAREHIASRFDQKLVWDALYKEYRNTLNH